MANYNNSFEENDFEEQLFWRKSNFEEMKLFEENQLEEFHIGRWRDPPYKNVDYTRRVQ